MTYTEYMANFNASTTRDRIVEWVRNWFLKNGDGCNAIIGISGGKDSSIVAALCVEALGNDRVIGILMPNGIQNDISYAYSLVRHLGIEHIVVNIESTVNSTLNSIRKGFSDNNTNMPRVFSEQTKINLPARIRMSTLYAIAQTWNGRVANTCNLSEDWVGYATRYGDSVGDFSPLAMLTTDEIIAIGKVCGLPKELVDKTPSDGLCGKSDEENLGFTYETLNEYIRTGTCDDELIRKNIDILHEKNLFKLKPMPVFEFVTAGDR